MCLRTEDFEFPLWMVKISSPTPLIPNRIVRSTILAASEFSAVNKSSFATFAAAHPRTADGTGAVPAPANWRVSWLNARRSDRLEALHVSLLRPVASIFDDQSTLP